MAPGRPGPASKKKKTSMSPQREREESPADDSGSGNENQDPQPGPSGMQPPPPPQQKIRGYRCKLCRKGFYDKDKFLDHKRNVHQVTPSVLTVDPDQVSLGSQMPEDDPPIIRRRGRPPAERPNLQTARKSSLPNPTKLPRKPKTRNVLPAAINNQEVAANNQVNRNPGGGRG